MNTVDRSITQRPVASPIAQAMQSASTRTGVDFDYLMDVARVESNYNPEAKASTSSARGLFQFTNQTWLATLNEHGANHGLRWAADAISRDANGRYSVRDGALKDQIMSMRDNPAVASSMAAAFTADNRAYLEPRIGRSAEPVDLYLAHFLGSGGAVNFLSAMSADPHQPGATLLPEAAAANPSIFYEGGGRMRSVAQIRELFRAKLENGSAPASSYGAAASGGMGFDPMGGGMEQMYPMTTPYAAGWQRSSSSTTSTDAGDKGPAGRPPLQMMDIQPMPKKLSMGFAADAYRRLASLSGGRA